MSQDESDLIGKAYSCQTSPAITEDSLYAGTTRKALGLPDARIPYLLIEKLNTTSQLGYRNTEFTLTHCVSKCFPGYSSYCHEKTTNTNSMYFDSSLGTESQSFRWR